MRILTRYLQMFGLSCIVVVALPAYAENSKVHKGKPTAPATHVAKTTAAVKPAKTKTTKSPEKTSGKPLGKTAEKSGGKRSASAESDKKQAKTFNPATSAAVPKVPASKCRVVKLKHGVRRQHCPAVAAAPAEPVLQSPIDENALNKVPVPDKNGEIKARTAPDRAYAVDGETFFYLGRKYRVAGLNGAGSNDMAKQRLQKALDSGSLTIEQTNTDDAGVATANVSINGHDVMDQLR
jgi:hypothetical protein